MPDHEIEGSNYTSVNSHRAYKDTDPPTDLTAADHNSVWRGLMRFLLDEGVTLYASAAAAASGNWSKLLEATRRIAGRFYPQADHEVDGMLTAFTPSLDVHAYRLVDDGTDRPGAEVDIDEITDNSLYIGRRLWVVNETDSVKYVLGADSSGNAPIVRLEPKRGCLFIGTSREDGALVVWEPGDGQDMRPNTISCKLYNSSGGGSSSAFDVEYSIDRRRGITTLQFPAGITHTATACDAFNLLQADGSDLPAELTGRVDGGILGAYLEDIEGLSYVQNQIQGTQARGDTGLIQFKPAPGTANFTAGTNHVYCPPLTFPNNAI